MVPSSAGGSAIVGVSSRSYSCHQASTPRATIWPYPIGVQQLAPPSSPARSASAQVSGSTSSCVTCLPVSMPQKSSAAATPAGQRTMNWAM